jgi:hypothetical protein
LSCSSDLLLPSLGGGWRQSLHEALRRLSRPSKPPDPAAQRAPEDARKSNTSNDGLRIDDGHRVSLFAAKNVRPSQFSWALKRRKRRSPQAPFARKGILPYQVDPLGIGQAGVRRLPIRAFNLPRQGVSPPLTSQTSSSSGHSVFRATSPHSVRQPFKERPCLPAARAEPSTQ